MNKYIEVSLIKIIWIILQKPQPKRNLFETKQIIEDSC